MGLADSIEEQDRTELGILKAKNQQLKKDLKKYGRHLNNCFIYRTNGLMNGLTGKDAKCDCGFEQILKGSK